MILITIRGLLLALLTAALSPLSNILNAGYAIKAFYQNSLGERLMDLIKYVHFAEGNSKHESW
jgi:hypothetical protein